MVPEKGCGGNMVCVCSPPPLLLLICSQTTAALKVSEYMLADPSHWSCICVCSGCSLANKVEVLVALYTF